MPSQIICASALPGKTGKHENCIFTQMLYQCIARIQPVTARFLQSFLLMTHTHDAVWLPESYNQCVPLGAVGRNGSGVSWSLTSLFSTNMAISETKMVQEKGSQECGSSWTVLHAQYTSVLSSGFPLSQGNTEALDKWGWKRKHHLISYFLNNTSA